MSGLKEPDEKRATARQAQLVSSAGAAKISREPALPKQPKVAEAGESGRKHARGKFEALAGKSRVSSLTTEYSATVVLPTTTHTQCEKSETNAVAHQWLGVGC